jgi:hypothetical protein
MLWLCQTTHNTRGNKIDHLVITRGNYDLRTTYDNALHIVLSYLQPYYGRKLTSHILNFPGRSHEWFGSKFEYWHKDERSLDMFWESTRPVAFPMKLLWLQGIV